MALSAGVPSLPLAICVGLCLSASAGAAQNPDWTTPIEPFEIADHLYYVGSRDLAAYLVTTPAGEILINANYTSSPRQIRRSVETLGVRWQDIKVLLISHAHVDHAGGAAQIRRETGAQLAVMDGDVDVMQSGGRTDFAFGGAGRSMQFPAAHVDRVLKDGDGITLGGTTLVAHRTAGHTRGTTTWTLKVHLPRDPAGTLKNAVIVGSWSVLDSYRLLGAPGGRPSSYPGIANDYAHAFEVFATLPCDVFLASHGSTFHMLEKLRRMPAEGDQVWVDPAGYRQARTGAQHAYDVIYRRQQITLHRDSRP